MTRRFCELCGKQLARGDGYMVEVIDEKRGSPYNRHSINPVCEDCATPALEIVNADTVKEFA